jgi:hypothetical protein
MNRRHTDFAASGSFFHELRPKTRQIILNLHEFEAVSWRIPGNPHGKNHPITNLSSRKEIRSERRNGSPRNSRMRLGCAGSWAGGFGVPTKFREEPPNATAPARKMGIFSRLENSYSDTNTYSRL